jgi:hypothetical protein
MSDHLAVEPPRASPPPAVMPAGPRLHWPANALGNRAHMLSMAANSLLASDQRHGRRLRFHQALPALSLVPPSLTVHMTWQTEDSASVLAVGRSCSLLVQAESITTVVDLFSEERSDLDALETQVRALTGVEDTEGPTAIRVWHRRTDGGARNDLRRVDLPRWADIAPNYPRAPREQLARLAALRQPSTGGQLIVWHGRPGTGKTTAALALLDAWSDWCDGHLVADPEKLFGDTGYLLDVIASTAPVRGRASLDGPMGSQRRWKLVIAEDAEELLRTDKHGAGAALGRLLNVTDGILARGTRTLMLLTTNDDVRRLHPALTRPGRCLSSIEFQGFEPSEASTWLGTGFMPVNPMTLAELYEQRAGGRSPMPAEPTTGMYL